MFRAFIIFCFIFSSNLSLVDPNSDQWKDSEKTYLDLINEGFEVKAYDISNFRDNQGNMYMFFVTVLQKDRKIYECQEYQIFDDTMDTLDLSFICRELVQPYKKGLKT